MSTRILFACCIACAVVLLASVSTTANESSPAAELDQHEQERIAQQAASLELARQALESKPAEAWTEAEVDAYLNSALWAVCYGISAFIHQNDILPDSPLDLAETEYLGHWPGNPLHDWAPMRVLALDDGFAAGELFLQICPPDYYSGLAHPVPRSFALGIYGRSEDCAPLSYFEPTPSHPWVEVPAGLLSMGGSFSETYKSLRKKWARMKQREKTEGIQN